MKSPIQRTISKRSNQPVIVVNDTKYISKIYERTLPVRHYPNGAYFEREDFGRFTSLYGIICIYILLVLVIFIGAGGVIICIVYYNSAENTQNWKIAGIVLGVVTCIIAIILLIVTIIKQTRNRKWRYRAKDVLLHPKQYFSEDSDDDISSDDSDNDDKNDSNDKTLDNTVTSIPNSSIGLLKTVHNDLVYCLSCNRVHPSNEECSKSKHASNSLSPLKYSRSSLKKKKSVTMADQTINYYLSNETVANGSGNRNENLVLKHMPVSTTKAASQQSPPKKIMIVRVPNVPGELIIQPKEH